MRDALPVLDRRAALRPGVQETLGMQAEATGTDRGIRPRPDRLLGAARAEPGRHQDQQGDGGNEC